MNHPIVLERAAGQGESAAQRLIQRAIRRFRLPLRRDVSLEQTAARNRAERLFEVNFRSTWTK